MKKPWYYFLIPQKAINYAAMQATVEIADKIYNLEEKLIYPRATKELLRQIQRLLRIQGHFGDLIKFRVWYEDLLEVDGHVFNWVEYRCVQFKDGFRYAGETAILHNQEHYVTVTTDGRWWIEIKSEDNNREEIKTVAQGASTAWAKKEAMKAYAKWYKENIENIENK